MLYHSSKTAATAMATRSSANAIDGFLLEQRGPPPPFGRNINESFSSTVKDLTSGDNTDTDANADTDAAGYHMQRHASSIWATPSNTSLFKQESSTVSKVRNLM